MATYLQNSTDVFPQIDYATPDYQLMSTALGALTQRYNAGFNKLRSMYSSLLNSPVSNPETEKMRQMWFQKNNEQLKQYAHVDLSVSSNVSSAMSSFDPLVENRSFVADMNYTRQYQQQAAQINQYKTSTDEKVRKLYNPLMEEYVQRGVQQLKTSKFDDIPSHSVRDYLAVEDPMSYLNAQAKEQGLKIVREQSSGMYILKNTNGDAAKQDFSEWAEQLLGSGMYGEYYNRAASVTVDRMVDMKLRELPGATREQALEQIGKESLPEIYKSHESYTNSIRYNIAQIDSMKNSAINKYGSKVPPQVAQQLQQVAQKRKELQAKLDDAESRPEAYAQAVNEVVQNFTRNPQGYQATLLRTRDSRTWASNYADVHAESEMRPDQVKLEMYQQQQQNYRQSRQFEHDMNKARLEHTFRLREKEYEKTLEAQGVMTQGVNEVATENQTPMEAFEKEITTKVAESSVAMTSGDVLAVTLNLPTSNGKVSGKIPGGSLGALQTAVRNSEVSFFRGVPLSKEDQAILNAFTMQTTGQKFTNFNQVQRIINDNVEKNDSHPLYRNATASLSKGMRGMAEVTMLSRKEQQTLASHAAAHPDHFTQDANGRWIRVGNHAADPVLSRIVPDAKKYEGATGTTLPTLTYNVNPDKSDMSHVTRVAQQSAKVGYYDSTGKFNEFSSEDAQAVKNIMGRLGTANLRTSVDANISITPGDRYNGKDMVRVTIPLVRSGEKGNLALAAFGLPEDVVEKAGSANSITFMVPAEKANQLGFNTKLIRTSNGSIISQPDLSSYMIGAAQSSAEETPFTSDLLKLNQGARSVPFPSYMRIHGQDGVFSMRDGQVYIGFYDKNGDVISEEATGVSKVTPQTARQLEDAAQAYIEQQENAKQTATMNTIQQNRSRAGADWVDVNKIFQ